MNVQPITESPLPGDGKSSMDSTSSSTHTTFSHHQQSSSLSTHNTTTSLNSSPTLDLKHPDLPNVTPSPSPSATSTSFNLLGVDGLPIQRTRNPDSQFTPAPLFSLARASSLRYPGWKPPNSARTSSGTDTRRDSLALASPPPVPPLPSHTTSKSEDNTPLSAPQRRFVPAKPLSPHHLAKIANAFGVQVPSSRSPNPVATVIPVGGSPSSSLSARPGSAMSTAMSSATRSPANTSTRFLLTVIPPVHLSPEDGTAHGPSVHFRRGTLIPLHATLPSQLAAIAREYSLPSTVGLVVYLLDVKHDIFGDGESIGEEWLGPRITEETWKMLWSGMLKAEREELARTMSLQRQAILPSIAKVNGMGQHPGIQRIRNISIDSATHPAIPPQVSSPSTPTTVSSPLAASSDISSPRKNSPRDLKSNLKPLLTEQALLSGPASVSGLTSTTNTGPPSLAMTRSESPSSIRTTTTPISPFLPSLPIVGKIEFDIDRSKATWYDSWLPRPKSRADPPSPLPNQMGAAPSPGLYPLRLGTESLKSPRTKAKKSHPSSPLPPSISTTEDEQESGESLIVPTTSGNSPLPRNSLLLDTKGQNDDDVFNERKGSVTPSEGTREDEDLVMVEGASSQGVGGEDDAGSGYEQLDDDGSVSDYAGECEEAQFMGVQTAKVVSSGLRDRTNEDGDDEDEDDEEDEASDQNPSGDPLAGVFPSDQETWEGMAESRPEKTDGRLDGLGVVHSDRAGFLGSEISEELPVPETSTDDFQEVLDMLNEKKGLDAEEPESGAPSSTPSFIQPAPPTLGSPIVLQEKNAGGVAKSPPTSPTSVTSADSKEIKRPSPLVITGPPSDRFPPITGGLEGFSTDTPVAPAVNVPATPSADQGLPYLNLSQPPATPKSAPLDGSEYGDEGLYDEYEEEQMLQKELDALEKTISQHSPRDLAPTPEPIPTSPLVEGVLNRRLGSMRGMPLNGIGGPKFRSEALGAELAHKIAEEREGKALSSIQESRSPSPNWPAVPFTSVNQDRVNVNSVYDDGAIVSEETQSRALLADEDSIIAAAKKYRPPTPGNRPEDAYRPSYVPSVTSPPIRISSLPSPKSSRFSADSAVSDEVTRSSIMGRSIRKLWRKTGTAAAAANKISVAAKNNTQKRGSSPPPPLPSAPPLSSSYLTSGSGNLGMPASATSSTFNFSGSTSSRPDSGLDPFHFDQESLRSPSPTAGAQSSPSGTTLKSTRSILKGRKPAPDTPPSILAPAPEKERGISGFFSRARKSHVPQAPSSPGAEGAVSEKRPSEESRRNSPPGQIPTSKSSTSVNRVLPPGVPKLFPTGFPLTASRSSFELDDGYRPSIDSGVGMGNALEEPVTPRLSQFEIVSPSLKTFDFK